MTTALQDEVDQVRFWKHSIDLGGGVVTPGLHSPENLQLQLDHLQLPDLRGKSFLDIGTWDGWFAFTAERLGAARVVALDHFVWNIPEFGKGGFDLAHRVLNSHVEVVWDDYMTIDVSQLGTFDVVLYSGVLYHMRDPLRSLERVAELTHGSAFIETHVVVLKGHETLPSAVFYETTELAGDPSNWWGPTVPGVEALCRSAGFRQVELLHGPPDGPFDGDVLDYRAVFRADK